MIKTMWHPGFDTGTKKKSIHGKTGRILIKSVVKSHVPRLIFSKSKHHGYVTC